jgi:hypothetical protein
MNEWVFNFPPLRILPIDFSSVTIVDDVRYPKKLVLWEHILGVDAKQKYNENEFTDIQTTLYSAIFNFYGKTLLEEEIRIYASLKFEPTDYYLSVVLNDYIALQHDLQNLFKLDPNKLYYVNTIERRSIFIDVQKRRSKLILSDISKYEINRFELFRKFPSPRISKIAVGKYQFASTVFWNNVTKLNNIDPFGNLYLTKSLDFTTLRFYIKKFPDYEDYFTERKKIKVILNQIVNLYSGLNQNVEELDRLMTERDALSHTMFPDLLERQERVLTSRKHEYLFVQINRKIDKLNSIFLTFNHSFVLSNGRHDSIDLRRLTDNFFYNDYILSRESIDDGLKIKLNETLKKLKT